MGFDGEFHAPGADDVHTSWYLPFGHQRRVRRIQREMSHPVQFGEQRMREITEITRAPQGTTQTTIRKHETARDTHKKSCSPRSGCWESISGDLILPSKDNV